MSDAPPAQTTDTAKTPSGAMLRTLSLVAAVSGFLVVMAYQVTLPMIEENKRIAIERALFKVVPGAETRRDFVVDGDGIRPAVQSTQGDAVASGTLVYAGYDADGTLLGIAMEAAAQGYQDVIRVLYGYDPACRCIRGIQVLKMAETPGIGDKIAKDPDFLQNFDALDVSLTPAGDALAHPVVAVKHGSKTDPWQIDAISGATISSNAVARMLDDSARLLLPVIDAHLDQMTQAPHTPRADGAMGGQTDE